MKKLWQKDAKNNQLVDEYCFKEGVNLDSSLVTYDVYGSIAHAQALFKLGIINKKELVILKTALEKILILKKQNKFKINFSDEDVHTKIENYLTNKLGNLGKKIHTARSRNDQVLVDLRLFGKEQLFSVAEGGLILVKAFYELAKKYEFIAMPGYTHMQKAMPSSLGMWLGSFVESLLDDLKLVKLAFDLNNQCPLGTGVSYGLPLAIDRQLTADVLGFAKVQNNSLYTQVSRPKIQIVIMDSLVQIMLTLSRFAEDLLLFTTSEFNFFKVKKELCTGSSIVPQKKNLDVMEYLRAKTKTVIGYQQIVATISAGLPSGYNGDFGETKGPFMIALKTTLESLEVVNLTLKSLVPNIKTLEKAMTPELFATQAVYKLVKKGVPFREAYLKIGKSLPDFYLLEIKKSIKLSTHIGGLGNLGLGKIQQEINKTEKWWAEQKSYHFKKINKLLKGESL